MSTTVLATKLFVPSRPERLVARFRLADELDRSLSGHPRLTLVSAPAGFGKTTLLSDWLDSQKQRRPNLGTAWLSLDSADNDLPRFLRHFAAALVRCGLAVDLEGLESRTSHGTAAMTGLLNQIAQASESSHERQWLVVFDDYHAIEAAEVHESVGFLLDNTPGQLHLAMATRSDPPLPLARLRSRGQLVELRAADLRFTPSEASEFLNQAMGLQLTTRDVDALDERTEGWIAGLQLAALSLRTIHSSGETADFIHAFTGSNRFVIDFLVDEVLGRLPSDAHQFLLRTSVLERLTGALCDAVTENPGGADMLERLERNNLFVVALDADRSWYRYHHLFADVLHARLLAEDADLVSALHERASRWYAAHDLLPDAIRHALAGGHVDLAANLIEQAIPQTRRARNDSTLLGWVRALPESAVRRSPVLSLASGWSMLAAGDLGAMEARLDDAEAALAAGRRDPALAATWADTEDLRTAPAAVSMYRAALAQARGDVAGTVVQAQHALDLAGPEDHTVRGGAGGFLGLAEWAAGDVDQVLSTFSGAARSLHAAGNLVDELDMTVVLADMWVTGGRPHQARRIYEQALAAATGHGEPYPRATADLHVGLAELDREHNDLGGAQAHLDVAKELSERASITERQHQWYVAAAGLRAAEGDHATATEMLDEAQARYRPGSYPDLRPITSVRARVQIASGDLDDAERWARDRGMTLEDDVAFLHEHEHLTLVRLHVARCLAAAASARDTEGAMLARVMEALRRLSADAEPRRAGSLLEIGMLQSLTLQAAGRHAEALAALDRALVQAPEPEDYVRLFLDEGAPMLDLLHEAAGSASDRQADTARRHARRILHAARADTTVDATSAAATRAPDGTTLTDSLSDRELEVLRLLDSELSGPEIARQLYVSLNTLRTHTKRIFTKLDVRNRSAAVRRGHQLGLL